jgi:hypothetical protein
MAAHGDRASPRSMRSSGERASRSHSTFGVPEPLRQCGLPDADLLGGPAGAHASWPASSQNYLRSERFAVLSRLARRSPPAPTQSANPNCGIKRGDKYHDARGISGDDSDPCWPVGAVCPAALTRCRRALAKASHARYERQQRHTREEMLVNAFDGALRRTLKVTTKGPNTSDALQPRASHRGSNLFLQHRHPFTAVNGEAST